MWDSESELLTYVGEGSVGKPGKSTQGHIVMAKKVCNPMMAVLACLIGFILITTVEICA